MLNSEFILEIFQKYNSFAMLISLLINIIVAIVGFLPSIFITGANIIFFGPLNGFFISLLGEVIGGYITFYVYRKGLKKGTEKLLNDYNLMKKLVRSKGKKAGLLILQGRLLPFMPSGIVTLASAVSDVNGKIFIMATLIGKIPSIALEVLISYQIVHIEENVFNLIITLVILGLIYLTLRYYKEE